MITDVDQRKLLPHQSAQVMIGSPAGTPPVEVFRTDEMIIEAPNWTLDGRWLILNGDGKLWLAIRGLGGAKVWASQTSPRHDLSCRIFVRRFGMTRPIG